MATGVTQVHGSMKGKNVLELVQFIIEKKVKETKEKDDQKKQKEQAREVCYGCKSQCVFEEPICAAINLQECPSCHNMKCSTCGKYGFKKDGIKP